MKSPDEQIRAILGTDVYRWARSQLAPGESLEDKQFCDFISVTEDEVIAYVETHGFDPDLVFESRDPKAWRSVPADDHLCLIDHGGRWEVCYAERGERSQAAEFATRTEAVRNLVRRMMGTAWIGLNAAYRDKHYPGRVLPKYGEPW